MGRNLVKVGRANEDYLEAIYIISNNNWNCKAIDVAKYLKVSKPTVSIVIKNLLKDDLIEKTENSNLLLTKKGEKIAKDVYGKHMFFKQMLLNAKVDKITAEEDACLMEHVISEKSFEKLKIYFKKVIK